MSASSLCVTWGTLSQERCRNGPGDLLDPRQGRGLDRPELGEVLRGDLRDPDRAGRGRAAAGWAGPFRNPSRSSLVIRPFGPGRGDRGQVHAQLPGGAPHRGPGVHPGGGVDCHRGVARGPRPVPRAAGPPGARPPGPRRGAGSCCSTSDGGVLTAPSPGVSSRMGLPSLTSSPTLTRTSATEPATGAGTSMVALSDSRVTSGSSALTWSPALTCTSMIGTAPKSPMSGTLTSVGAVMSIVSFLIGSERSGERGCGLVGVDVVAGDGVRCGRGRNGALGGQLGQRGERDVVPVDLEVPAQVAPVVRAPEPVGAEHPVPAVHVGPDLVGEGPHVVGRGDHRAGRAPGQALLRRS